MQLNEGKIKNLAKGLLAGLDLEEELIGELLPLARAIAWRFVHQYPRRRVDLMARAEAELVILVNNAGNRLYDGEIIRYVAASIPLALTRYLRTDYLIPIDPRSWTGEGFQVDSLDVAVVADSLEGELVENVDRSFVYDLLRICVKSDEDLIVFFMRLEGFEQPDIADILNVSQPTVSRRIAEMYDRWKSHEALNGFSHHKGKRKHERIPPASEQADQDCQGEVVDGQLGEDREGPGLHEQE